ncbi:MAG TPA: pyrroline-5-carboxylate reductase dimerization domain-containing protein, partial [Myxococcaceae bacterium]|nr:pyrroline-5-carboxylate reductase dimerization domain-containing protein [Myxococcaceae bacterium]
SERLVFQALVGLAGHLSDAAREAGERGVPFSPGAELRGLLEQVATPGGMNDAALRVLEREGFARLLEAARLTYQSKEKKP